MSEKERFRVHDRQTLNTDMIIEHQPNDEAAHTG